MNENGYYGWRDSAFGGLFGSPILPIGLFYAGRSNPDWRSRIAKKRRAIEKKRTRKTNRRRNPGGQFKRR